MHNKKIIAKGLVFTTVLVNVPIDSLANTIEEVKITNIEDNIKEGETKNGIKKFFAKRIEPIEELISKPKEVIKVNKNIVRGSVLEISLVDGQFVQDLSGNPGGYETVKVTTTGDKKLVKADYDNLRLSGIPKVDLSNAYSDDITMGAFTNATHLTEFKFPQGLSSISKGSYSEANGAFANCVNLSGNLIIPDTVELIGVSAFIGCTGFTGNLIIPDSVKTIRSSAFYRCSGFDGELVLSNNLSEIDYGVFFECAGLTGDLIIPNSVITIQGNAFNGCTGFNGNLTLSNSLTAINMAAFNGCTGFSGNLIIPDSVKSIGANVFRGCTGFNGNLTLSKTLESIGSAAFQNCKGFTGDLFIPNSVTTIATWAFNGCSGFNGKLTLSDSLTELLEFSFSGCSGLTGDLIIPQSVEFIGRDVFSGCSKLTGNLVLPDSLKTIQSGAFYRCSGFTGELVIPNTVTSVGNHAFYNCRGFNGGFVIGNSVISIGNSAFNGCSGLTGNLVIPDSVTTIDNYAFSGCTGLTGDLIIPNSIATISEGAFQGCRGFDGNLVIPNSVSSIGPSAFNGCTELTGSLIIPNSVINIGLNAFRSLSKVEKIIIKVDLSDSDTNYKENIINNLPDTAQTVIDLSYDFNASGTWLETTNKTIGKPVIKNVVGEVESELIDYKGEAISLYVPSSYKDSNISVLRDNKLYTLPKVNSDGKHIFTEPGIYQVTITTDLGNTSIISFEVEDPIVKEIEENLRELETVKDADKISGTRELINSLPESIKKDQLQEQLNNIFPDIELEKKTASANLDIYIKSENMLSLSLNTNSVTFENYSGAEPMEKLGAVNIAINSSLPYNLNAYMPTEITSSDGNNKMDMDILNIRESNEGVYKQFEDATDKVVLIENCAKGNNINHSIDLKLDSSDTHVADIYKTVIKFEAEQK